MQPAHHALLALAQIHFLPSLQNHQDSALQGVTEALVRKGARCILVLQGSRCPTGPAAGQPCT